MTKDSFERFKRVLQGVLDSRTPFYKKKYADAGFDGTVDSIEDARSVPLLERSELVATPLWERLYMPIEEVLLCGYTSGTTSSTLFPLLRNYYIAEAPDIDAKKLLLLSMQHWRVVVQAEWFRRKNIFLACGDINNLPVTAKIASVVGIDSVYATPTVALLLAPHLAKVMDLGSITTLLLYGEMLSDVRREALQRTFPSAHIRTHYAFSEVGPVGFSCLAPGKEDVYHQDEHFFYEVVDPVTGEVLPEGEEGELVITTLEETPTPLIRYRTGDLGAVHQTTCECSRKKKTFRVIGRSGYDTIKIGGLELKAPAFEKGAATVADLIDTDRYEVHVYEEESGASIKPLLEFHVHPQGKLAAFERTHLEESIRRGTIVGPRLSVEDAERQGYLLPSRFVFEENEAGTPMTFKKKRILVRH